MLFVHLEVCEKVGRSKKTSCIPSNTSKTAIKNMDTCSYSDYLLAVFEVVEVITLQRKCGGARRASSKCRHWEIHEKVKDWIDQILQVEPPTRSRDMIRNHVTDLVGNVLWQVISIFSVCCFCVNMACFFPSHRAAKKRNDKVSCERPHSY